MQPTLINPPTTEQTEEKKSDDKNSDSDELPPEIPSELRTAYIRARLNITPEQRSAFNQPCNTPGPENIITATETETPDEIPLPSDFDIDIEPEAENYIDTDFSQMKVPTFSDINFDSVPTAPDTTNELTQYLDNKSIEYKIEDDLIITDKHTIASHTDSDFWICDDDNWFATGKQCPSPIPKLLKIASENKTKPIMYLGATNIMDLDTIRQKWESMGITVITSPDEIN